MHYEKIMKKISENEKKLAHDINEKIKKKQ